MFKLNKMILKKLLLIKLNNPNKLLNNLIKFNKQIKNLLKHNKQQNKQIKQIKQRKQIIICKIFIKTFKNNQ